MPDRLRLKLKAARKKQGLTQEDASKVWGIPLGTLICWENDQRTPRTFALKVLNEMLDRILAADGKTEETKGPPGNDGAAPGVAPLTSKE